MTQQEASECYNIPVSILQEYESWGLCGAVKKVMGVWQYDDEDLEWVSIILTLHDIGFTTEEAETYMRLLLEQPDVCYSAQLDTAAQAQELTPHELRQMFHIIHADWNTGET